MKHLLSELADLEQKRKFMLSELLAELDEEYEAHDIKIALEDSWGSTTSLLYEEEHFSINYSQSCDGAYFTGEDVLFKDEDYTLVEATVYDDGNRPERNLILLSTAKEKL